jgi:hypothetical protein
MLSDAELKTCRGLLQSAYLGVLWTAQTFFNDSNLGGAARLRAVAARITDEIRDIDKLLLSTPPKP